MSEQYKLASQAAKAVKTALAADDRPALHELSADLRRMTKKLRMHYQAANSMAQRPAQDEWLCDNYYVLEKESKQTQRELRHLARQGRLPELGLLACAVEQLLGKEMPSIEDGTVQVLLEELQVHGPVSERQFAFLPCAMKISLIRLAYRACLEQQAEAGIAYAIVGLGKLTAVDFDAIVQQCSPVEELLEQDPAGVYAHMSCESRSHYRYLVSKIARETGATEVAVSGDALRQAQQAGDPRRQHVGWYLLNHPAIRQKRLRRGRAALWWGALLPLVLACALWILCNAWWVALLCYLPLYEILRPLISQRALAGVDVSFLPRMDLRKVKQKPKTMVLVSTLLPKAADADALARRLEQLYFSNSDSDLYYCILADFKEWDFPADEKDDSQVAATRRVVEELNRQYQDHFFLFLRGRTYNKSQKKYSGWERKRGGITEFVRFLKGDKTSVQTFVGDRAVLEDIRFLIALDADTSLLYESAQTLISVAMHPLNRPLVDETGIVSEGYGILAPKISNDLDSARATSFSRVLNGCGGVTAYDTKDKDFYQDLFSESIFAGKGLLDVDAFYQILDRRFPDNQILSHDILEGAYLRCGFVSDVEMTDGSPGNMTAWLSRLHRWIRGDWQNVPYLSSRPRIAGRAWDNPISPLSKYKLWDNLRRSLVPVLALACVTAALFAPAPAAAALAVAGVLSVTFSSLWAALCSLLSGGVFTLSRKFFTRTLSHTFELIAQALFLLVMTPVQAFLAVDAALRSLWRTYVSRKNLLEWTTAAQSGSAKITVWSSLKRYWLPELFGLVFLALSLDSLLCLAGLAFAAVLPVAYFTASTADDTRRGLTAADRDALISYNAAMWRYYEDFANAQNHYLPPDNIQQSPVYRVAARTSPTNIGMMMLSVLAARDMDLIDTPGLFLRIDRTLTTVETLEKWHGNLYNWYDTETLDLLHPAFVSTVDSGNFICCLVALGEGLREFIPQDPRFAQLAARVRRIVDETDLTPFYNKKKHLFSIGWDVESQALSGSHYDFLMSEARLTSYYAVARKIVDKKHWGRMGRTMSRNGSYAGPVSWTGTMFEYYMPHLLLPVYEGSLLSEALIYCLYCQKKWAKSKDIPWGISESAFYSFDNNLNYQYKAHGVQKLGVKRYLDRELVISPYSTFITIPQNPNSSMENLRGLRKLGVYGRYGFFEAVDFTPGRVGSGSLAVTRSYMAHHIGMSMVASCNALFNNRMQRRFMKDHYMKSANEFLQEKIAKSTVVYDELKSAGIPDDKQDRPRRVEESDVLSPTAPRCALLTNGELTDILADSGPGYLKFGNIDLTRRSEDLIVHSQGFLGLVRAGGQTLSVTKAPFFDPGTAYKVEHQEQSVTYYASKGNWEAGMRCLIHPTISCQQRQIVLKNKGSKKEAAQILLYFEPILAAWADYSAHPAYSKLFVTARYNPETKTITFTRREKDGTNQMYLTVGFLQDLDFTFETRREALMRAPGGIRDLWDFHKKEFSGNGGGVPDACCAVRLDMTVSGGGQSQATLLLCASRSEEEGVQSIITMRSAGLLEPKQAARSPLLADSLEGRLGCNLLGKLLFAQNAPCANEEEKRSNRCNQRDLWCTGISGDLPLVVLEPAEDLDEDTLRSYLRLHAMLRGWNVEFDLGILYSAADTLPRLQGWVEQDCPPGIVGARGGVFLLHAPSLSPETLLLIRAVSRHSFPREGAAPGGADPDYLPVRLEQVAPAPMPTDPALAVSGGACANGRFYVDKTSPLPYCHVLAAPASGALLSDQSLGYTWAYNSRENKLTPWNNDICADNRGELCVLRDGDRFFDLASGSRASFSPADAVYEGTAGKVRSRITVTVAARGCAKYTDVLLSNPGEERSVQLAYYTEPVLGVNRSTSRFIAARELEGSMVLSNPYNLSVQCHMALTAVPLEGTDHWKGGSYMTHRASFFSGNWSNFSLSPQDDPCAAVIIPLRLPAKRDVRIRFILSAGHTASGAVEMARLSLKTTGEEELGDIRINTPDEALNQFINHFAPHQILSSRIRGRCAFYQCGGAYGFRDQLQDVGAYLLRHPPIAKRQILRCCAVQFPQGDVLHWWHDLPGGVRGVRTRFSDDLLWLPLIAAEYVRKTGDSQLLDIPVHYLEADPLPPGVQESYIAPRRGELMETVFHHCRRALDQGYRVDERGLPYIGCGDWNDGFSGVGVKGKGVSVWLALFLVQVMEAFAPLCAARGEDALERTLRERCHALRQAVDDHCWDGDWYIRAFFDSGEPMGSSRSQECRIDLLPQSFAALADMPDKSRVERGLDQAWERLVDRDLHLVRLFAPPFAHSAQSPGYVKAYPSGIRENGGQYTHSAVWFAQALLSRGRTGQGWEILGMLNPLGRAGRTALAQSYKLEPYYMAADIYTNPSAPGRGGWSLYTGAVSWYYRVVLENLLGLRLQGGALRLSPQLPPEWSHCTLQARLLDTALEISLRRERAAASLQLFCDGKEVKQIPLDGAAHRIEAVFP